MRIDWFLRAGSRGATAIEYGLIAALVAVVIITGLTALGSSLDTKFTSVADHVQSASPGGGSASEEEPDTPTPTETAAALPATPTPTEPPPTDPPPTAAPIEINFNADAYDIERGECTTLRWEVTGATLVTLLGEEVEPTDAQEVCPGETAGYTLLAENEAAEESSYFEVKVTEPTRDSGGGSSPTCVPGQTCE